MSARSLVGLMAFDALLVLTGFAFLFALTGRLDRRSLIRYGGLAFWLGAGALGLTLTLLAISTGVGPRVWVATTICIAFTALASAVGVWRRRSHREPSETYDDRFGIVAALFASLVGVMLVALLAASYNRPPVEWDGWAFWIPKAKVLYFSGSLDADVFSAYSGTTYPILVPILHAVAFGFMGSADEVSLHFQTWVFIAAFAWAVVGLLRPRVPHALIWPFVALMVSLPEVTKHFIQLDGDYPSFYVFVLGALAMLRWLDGQERWPLLVGAILLAACASTKREGTAYVLAVGFAALLATLREPRRRWPPIALVTAGVLLTTVPWRLWLASESIEADSRPPEGVVVEAATEGGGRLLTAARVVLEFVFKYEFWSVAPWIGVVLVAAGFVLGNRRPASFVLGATSVVFAAMVWRVLWYGGEDEAENSSIPRVSGTISLLVLAAGPLLAHALIRDSGLGSGRALGWARDVASRVPTSAAVALAVVSTLGYFVVGLVQGDFRFVDCIRAPDRGAPVVVVFGRPDTWEGAARLRDRALEVGFRGTRIGFDRCGDMRVQIDEIPSVRVGEEIQVEARTVGLSPTIEGA